MVLFADIPEPFTGRLNPAIDPFVNGSATDFWKPKSIEIINSTVDFPINAEYGFLRTYDDTDIIADGITTLVDSSLNLTDATTPTLIFKEGAGEYSIIPTYAIHAPPYVYGNNELVSSYFLEPPLRPPVPIKDYKNLIKVEKETTDSLQYGETLYFDTVDEVWKSGNGPTNSRKAFNISPSTTSISASWAISTSQVDATPELDPNVWILWSYRPAMMASTFFNTSILPNFGIRDAKVYSRRIDGVEELDSRFLVKTFRTFQRPRDPNLSRQDVCNSPDTCWLLTDSPSVSGTMLTDIQTYYPTTDRVIVSSPQDFNVRYTSEDNGIYYQEGLGLVDTDVIRPNCGLPHIRDVSNDYVPVMSGGSYTFATELDYESEKLLDYIFTAQDSYDQRDLSPNIRGINMLDCHYGKRKAKVQVPRVDSLDGAATVTVRLLVPKWDASIKWYGLDVLTEVSATQVSPDWYETSEIDLPSLVTAWRTAWSCKGLIIAAKIVAGSGSIFYRYGKFEFTTNTLFQTPYRFDVPQAGWDGFTSIKGKIPSEVKDYYEPEFQRIAFSTTGSSPSLSMNTTAVTSSSGGEITFDLRTNYLFELLDANRDNYRAFSLLPTGSVQQVQNLREEVARYTTNYISVYDSDTKEVGRFDNTASSVPIPFSQWQRNPTFLNGMRIDFVNNFTDIDAYWTFGGTFPYTAGPGKIYITAVFSTLCVDIRYGTGQISAPSSIAAGQYYSSPNDQNREYVKWKKTWIFDKTDGTFTEGPDNLDSTQPWK